MLLPPISKNDRVKILPKLELGEYLLKHQRIDGGFGTLEETFWAVNALYYLYLIDTIDKDALMKYILDCKRVNGFAASPHESEIDLHSLYYAISILFLIKKQKILSMDEFESIYNSIFNFQKKNGGFSHCNSDFCPICKGKASLKSTYFAIYCLKLLYDIVSFNEKRILVYLSKKKTDDEVQQIFRLLSLLLLNHIEEIDESSITNLINLQQKNGGFGTIEYSFWIVYCLNILKRLRNINKGKLFEYFRSLQRENKSFSAVQIDQTDHQLNIRTTAWATISLTILWNELVEYIEEKILFQIYSNNRVLIEQIAEECFVRFDLIIYVIKNLMKYDWFSVKIRDMVDIFKEYVQKFDAVSRRIACDIIKYIINQNMVNLSELAKTYSASDYSKALQRVITIATQLINDKFVIGEIKWNKRFFRVTAFLNGMLPGKVIIRSSQIPYHEVSVEKGQVPIEERRIQETIEQIKPISDRIRAEIDNLLDINEVELAREHLKKDINEALSFLNSSNQNIERNINKFQYLNGEYTHFLIRDWVSVYHETKDSLLEIEKEYLKKIEKKEEIVQILKDLESFQDYVQDQLNSITEELNNTQKLFQQSCEENILTIKKDEIKSKLDRISLSVERITPQLRQQATNLFKASSKLRLSQDASQLSALQPLEKWLESMWMKKRQNTLKIIKDIRAHINAREDIQENIKRKKELFEFKLKELSSLINSIIESNQFQTANKALQDQTEGILNYLSESNHHILSFIQDTASYLEGFQITIDDVYQNWSKSVLEGMRNELISVKSDLEKQILSKRELDKNAQLNDLIEKNILELKRTSEIFEKHLLNFIDSPKISESNKEIKRKLAEIDDITKSLNHIINNFIKKTTQEFRNFPETSQITLHKWTLFKESLRRNLSLISDKIKNELIIKMLYAIAPIFRGGRVKMEYLASKIYLKKDEIEDRIVYLISIGKLEAQFDKETNEILPLTKELKALLKFERMMQDEMESLKTNYERMKRLFETSCRKKQLDDKVIGEIMERTRGVLSKKNETEVAIEKKIKELPQHIDLSILLKKWSNQKLDLEQNLSSIKLKINQRIRFKEKIIQFVKEIKTQINEIASPIEIKIDFGEIIDAKKLLSKNISQMEHRIKKFDKELKNTIDKISNDLERFDLVVADLLNEWIHEKTRLKTDLSELNARLEEKINENLNNKYKNQLEELIHNFNIIVNNFLNNYEKDVDILIQKGDIVASLSSLRNFHKKFISTEKNCQYQINKFIINKSKSLKTFKDTINTLITRWDLSKQEHQKAFQENYLQLENQIIIKYLQIQQTVFTISKLRMAELSKKLHIKKNELSQRFISLITAGKLSGKINPNTEEYIFPNDRIADAELERPSISIQSETPMIPLKHRILDRIFDIFRKWYPIIGSAGSVTGASLWIFSSTGNILFSLLIPIIIFPTIIFYVLYKHFKQNL